MINSREFSFDFGKGGGEMTEMCRNILENCEEFRLNNLENLGNFHLFEESCVSKKN